MNAAPKKETTASVGPAFVAGICALLLWSGTPIANKIAVRTMDAGSAGILRSLLAGLCALLLALLLRLPFPKSGHERKLLFVSGFTSFALWPMLLSLGIGRTTAGHAGLLLALIPIFTVIIAALVDRKPPNRKWWIGAALAFGGSIGLMVGRGQTIDGIDGASLIGDLIIVAGTMTCAVGYVAGGKLSPRLGTYATTFWGLAVALVLLVPAFFLLQDRTDWSAVPRGGWLAIGWMSFFSSLAGYGLWFFALGRGGIGRIGSLQLAMPVVTLSAAVLVLGEPVSGKLLFSGAAVVTGTFFAQRQLG